MVGHGHQDRRGPRLAVEGRRGPGVTSATGSVWVDVSLGVCVAMSCVAGVRGEPGGRAATAGPGVGGGGGAARGLPEPAGEAGGWGTMGGTGGVGVPASSGDRGLHKEVEGEAATTVGSSSSK